MNTTKIGDEFEARCRLLIREAIKNGELGILESSARVFEQKAYFGKLRQKDIIFDLAIEVWPNGAQRYSLLFLIECKSSKSRRVPVDDVEEFYSKIGQVSEKNVKGVMISDRSFQESSLETARNAGFMLIEVDDGGYKIILHRTDKEKNKKNNIKTPEDLFLSFIQKTLGSKKVEGLKQLSGDYIETFALQILDKYNNQNPMSTIDIFIEFLKKEFKLTVDFTQDLDIVNGQKITGLYDVEGKTILIDKEIDKTVRFPFIFGHELGHFFLHSELKMNQAKYNDFSDSHYEFMSDRHKLENDKNWIEWQANKFSMALFLSKKLFLEKITAYRREYMNRGPNIYLDDQPVNQIDYKKTVDYLADFFQTSGTAIKCRIEDLGLITNAESIHKTRNIYRDYPKKFFIT